MEPAVREEIRSANEVEDVISKLPDDLAVCIMEKLEFRDAVRVGVLSQRWRSLTHQLPRLSLHIRDFMPDGEDNYYYEDEDESGDENDEAAAAADHPPDALKRASKAMVEAMAALVASRAAGGCCTLVVGLALCHDYMSIGHLLDDAMATDKVREIELTVGTTYDDPPDGTDVDHASKVLRAYGRRFRMLYDGCPAAFGGLTRLTLKDMQLRGGDFDNILTACTRLEAISLNACECEAGARGVWRVQHARLAELTIHYCGFGEVDLACLPRLERFTYRSWFRLTATRPPMSFGHVPRLATVTLSNVLADQPALRLSQILANTAVTDLRLNFKAQNIWVKPEGPKRFANMFSNLKYVKIRNLHEDCGLSWITFLLQASPSLKELHIKLCDLECVNQKEEDEDNFAASEKANVPWEVAASFKHYGLTLVTITLGLHNNNTGERVAAYIRHLVEAAVNLEEIRVRKNTPCKDCGVAGTGFPRTDQERDSLRQRISGGEPVPFKICIQS